MIHVLIKDLRIERSGNTGKLSIVLLKLLHSDVMGIQQSSDYRYLIYFMKFISKW